MKDKFSLVHNFFLDLQKNICNEIEKIELQQKFFLDKWEKPSNEKLTGKGCSAVIKDGTVIEKGGVNFSFVEGDKLPQSASLNRPNIEKYSFQATGVSVVMHPKNPLAPTSHCNVRLFYAKEPKSNKNIWWFGGGFDLTPFYGFEEDCYLWHKAAYDVCLPFGKNVYAKFKKWCDEYFYLPHRQEQRGIGGIFFDDLNEWEFEKCFEFIQAVGNVYYKTYCEILTKRHPLPYNEEQRSFQLHHRGRYVEFNLIYDRGTLFGIKSGGRTKSILMSLPPKVSWEYDYKVKKNSPEQKLYDYYLKPQNWLNKK